MPTKAGKCNRSGGRVVIGWNTKRRVETRRGLVGPGSWPGRMVEWVTPI